MRVQESLLKTLKGIVIAHCLPHLETLVHILPHMARVVMSIQIKFILRS